MDDDICSAIGRGQCPFCDSKRRFIVLAVHTVKAHGVSGYELREMAGLNRGTSICDSGHSRRCSLRQKAIIEEHGQDSLEIGRQRDRSQDDHVLRPEGRETRMKIAESPEHKQRFTALMVNVPHEKRSAAASGVTEAANTDRTERILRAAKAYRERVGETGIKEAGKRAYDTWVERWQEQQREGVNRKIVASPEDVHKRAARKSVEIVGALRHDPEWRTQWYLNILRGTIHREANRKIPIQQYRPILERLAGGETQDAIAKDHGVTREAIRNLLKRSKNPDWLRAVDIICTEGA